VNQSGSLDEGTPFDDCIDIFLRADCATTDKIRWQVVLSAGAAACFHRASLFDHIG
jgi:hypothetical protein